MLTNKEDIKAWLDQYGIQKYTINEDMTVDVDGDVSLEKKKLKYIPVQFNKINGKFNCSDNQLMSLEGCPKEVKGGFLCHNNKLKSLKYSPILIEKDFICSHNKLRNLLGCCQNIKGDFYAGNNELKSLAGCPETVEGNFDCSFNKLTSLDYCANTIKGHFMCRENKLTSLVGGPTIVMKNYSCGENNIVSLEGFNCDHYTSFNHSGSLINSLEDYYVMENNELKLIIDKLNLDKAVLYDKLNNKLDSNKKIEKKIKI